MEMTFFQVLWFFLIFLLIAGYFVLDGFDLGAGVLYPFVAKSERDKAVVRRSIGPVWDGNEVWLLTAGGALFAAFPPAYATTFSGFYLAVMLVLFGLIVRAVSVEFRGHDPQVGAHVGRLLLRGVALAGAASGRGRGQHLCGHSHGCARGNYIGLPLIGLITPFTLLTGLLGLAMFLAAGATWIALKAPKPSTLQARAAKLRLPLQVVALVLFAAVSLYGHFGIQPAMDPALGVLRWVFALVFVAGIVVSLVLAKKKDCDKGAFVAQSASAVALVGLLATSMFPNLVVASAGSIGPNITLMSAASSELSLMWMTIITCVGLPLVLVYHMIVYRTFRGRVSDDDLGHY